MMSGDNTIHWSESDWLAFEAKFDDVVLGKATQSVADEVVGHLEVNESLRRWAVERLQDECLIREEMSLLEAVSELSDYSILSELIHSAHPFQPAARVANSRNPDSSHRNINSRLQAISGVPAVLASLLVCSLLINGFMWSKVTPSGSLRDSERSRDERERIYPTARLVRETGCTWHSPAGPTLSLGETLAGGESLELLEGIAEVHFQQEFASGLVRIQGPGAVVPRADGVPILLYGKVTLEVNLHGGQFVLETPFGHVQVHRASSFGLIAEDGQVQVHVFDGELTVHSVWIDERDSNFAQLESGEAIVFDRPGDKYQGRRSLASSELFASELSMFTDQLQVGDEYAAAVLSCKPVNYWRFNETPESPMGSGRVLKNEIEGGMPLHVSGSVTSIRQPGNRTLEFGMTRESGFLHSDGDWSPASLEEYSIEFWAKPSHFHNGAILSLINSKFPDSARGIHGLLIEIGGPHNLYARHTLPNSIRFMGREFRPKFKSDSDKDKDMAELSVANSYDVRKWAHVVAAGTPEGMRLYVNGQLVAENSLARPQSKKQKLIVGQVYFDRAERRFIGQLDEMAIYDRALTAQEILAHYDLGFGSKFRLKPIAASAPLSLAYSY